MSQMTLTIKHYQSQKWKDIARLVRSRDGNRCQGWKYGYKCNRTVWKRDSHIHHIDNNPMNNSMSNLILLCPDCHSKRHGRYLNVRNRYPHITIDNYGI